MLNSPLDVTLDDSNSAFYVADQKNNRIQKCLIGASDGTTVAGHADGTWCLALDCLRIPSRVLVDLNGNLYITDTGNQRIQFWTKGASSGTRIAGDGKLRDHFFLF
jgi:sugar lactone lactonase YvrE